MEVQVECGHCWQSYSASSEARIPRILPCGHSLCTACLGKIRCKPKQLRWLLIAFEMMQAVYYHAPREGPLGVQLATSSNNCLSGHKQTVCQSTFLLSTHWSDCKLEALLVACLPLKTWCLARSFRSMVLSLLCRVEHSICITVKSRSVTGML